eukprot:2132995-Rhodomonas_salina.3
MLRGSIRHGKRPPLPTPLPRPAGCAAGLSFAPPAAAAAQSQHRTARSMKGRRRKRKRRPTEACGGLALPLEGREVLCNVWRMSPWSSRTRVRTVCHMAGLKAL